MAIHRCRITNLWRILGLRFGTQPRASSVKLLKVEKEKITMYQELLLKILLILVYTYLIWVSTNLFCGTAETLVIWVRFLSFSPPSYSKCSHKQITPIPNNRRHDKRNWIQLFETFDVYVTLPYTPISNKLCKSNVGNCNRCSHKIVSALITYKIFYNCRTLPYCCELLVVVF